ncbi:hypothetical protein N9954_04850 [Maribacter sp.]|nr:hypothetical protein [Maribacter sp.]
MLKNQITFIIFFLMVFAFRGLSQETTLFKVSDFDLNGNVKSCHISTDYGKEEYSFNTEGYLTESVTRFSDSDYDITLYTYQKGELLEKRVEQYRNKALDRATSIANFYTIDTTGNRKVTEKIVSYNKEFLEQNEYFYTTEDKLSKIIRTNNDGIDETSVIYYQEGNASIADYFLNRELQQSIQTAVVIQSDTVSTNVITTKKFFDGEPNTAIEKVFNNDGKVSSETQFSYDADLKKFIPSETVQNTYLPSGGIEKKVTKKGTDAVTKEYLYQFDPSGNWVKQIVTPDNTYKTRKIKYYKAQESVRVEE